jgi:hydrogenase maturation protein HypF
MVTALSSRAWGASSSLETLCRRLLTDCPPLGRVDAIERRVLAEAPERYDFVIAASAATEVHTLVIPDAATCRDCGNEILDPANRRFRYPFTNCTHCGPRLSIVHRIPYDRVNTSMSVFPMCSDCGAEYADPADRRFHAQPNACPVCGPRLWLADADGRELTPAELGSLDAVAAAGQQLADGRIIAIRGIGGFHLACDATNADTVSELRRRKRRWAKPFALMARDLDVIRCYCHLGSEEARLLSDAAAPVVLLECNGGALLAPDVAPGQSSLGFMLPYSPMHRLLLQDWQVPLVMTSGNRSDEPQCIGNDEALVRLQGLADAFLLHDREIVNRVDDSVARFMDGAPRLLRRARGYAPASLPLPAGFRKARPILALGAELKNTICLLQDGQAVLSQHLGDLGEAKTSMEHERTIALYRRLFQHRPEVVAVDRHPGYRASRIGRDLAVAEGLELIEVQHHRAHIAAVLADNDWPLHGAPVLGVALDGSGYGDDGSSWGGEWLIGDYRCLERVAHLRTVALPGGTQAIREPWRNLFAQIVATLGWDSFERQFGTLKIATALRRRPIGIIAKMIEGGVNSPPTSSCGRLFDAVAAALDICPDGIAYEGQAAMELEAICRDVQTAAGYRFGFTRTMDFGCWTRRRCGSSCLRTLPMPRRRRESARDFMSDSPTRLSN